MLKYNGNICIGAIYNWNALFDTFPNKAGMIVYYCIALAAAIVIWILADKKEKQKQLMDIRAAERS